MVYERIVFSHARTALKYGLKNFNIIENDQILIPKYICESIVQTLEKLKIKPIFYKVKFNLKPDWDDVQTKFNKKVKGILAVHYFGEPQNLDIFRKFCSKNNILLIEDNAHGWGSTYKSKNLGEIGDFGIISPRKVINIKSGGYLVLKNSKKSNMNLVNLKREKNFFNIWKYKSFIKNMIKSKPLLYKSLKSQPKYWELDSFRELEIDDKLIDYYSLNKIVKVNLNKLRERRRFIYQIWEEFIKNNTNLKPVFKKLDSGTSPYIFPAFTNSSLESKSYFDWGWRNGFEISSWPTLPKQLSNDKDVKSLWEMLICFPINETINPHKLKSKLDLMHKKKTIK